MPQDLIISHLLALTLGLLIGLIVLYGLMRGRLKGFELLKLESARQESREVAFEQEKAWLSQELQQRENDLRALQSRYETLLREQSALKAQLDSERIQQEEKIQLLTHARQELSQQFSVLANQILEEKTQKFTEQNQTQLTQLLDPLKEKIQAFQGKVEEVYIQEGKERSALAEQVKQLTSLNQQLSLDAHNLTTALKGQSKTQGDWGEFILEKLLEASGLSAGLHYEIQESHTRPDGSRAQPDVVIRLPENRQLVVDAKVSLSAYAQYVESEDEDQKRLQLARHIESVRTHIKGLSGRNYQELYQLNSLDFVIMFIPIEPAFLVAISSDEKLWQDAWERNVLLVSPSTLLFVVRTVANLWRQEQQNRNALEIARRGGELYDKFCGFVQDLEQLGKQMQTTQKTYDQAFNKLSAGRGNLLRQAELLRDLGLKPTKRLPEHLIDLDEEADV
jgi:DNA recombination protein RmuC